MTDRVCPSCQRAVPVRSRWYHHAHGYECGACYWRAQRAAKRHKERVCEYCEGTFSTTRADALYCSASCRQKALRYRRRVAKFRAWVKAQEVLTTPP